MSIFVNKICLHIFTLESIRRAVPDLEVTEEEIDTLTRNTWILYSDKPREVTLGLLSRIHSNRFP